MVKIKKLVRKYVFKKLLEKGFDVKKMNSKEKVIEFIEKLHPVKTQYELIRIGPNTDGGYLVPDDLQGIEACFSPGVDQVSEFELECINLGMKVFMADKSVDKPNLSIPETSYGFLKKYIGTSDNDDFITMDTWVNQSLESKISELILQMDIEGSEYYSILKTSSSLMKRFRIMVFEFHYLERLWDVEGFDLLSTVFDKILETHICVHIHPNNCCGVTIRQGIEIPRVAEFTFIRKDRVNLQGYQNIFPNILDFDNTSKPSMILSKDWYRQ